MTAISTTESFWSVTKANAKEAVDLYFDPLHQLLRFKPVRLLTDFLFKPVKSRTVTDVRVTKYVMSKADEVSLNDFLQYLNRLHTDAEDSIRHANEVEPNQLYYRLRFVNPQIVRNMTALALTYERQVSVDANTIGPEGERYVEAVHAHVMTFIHDDREAVIYLLDKTMAVRNAALLDPATITTNQALLSTSNELEQAVLQLKNTLAWVELLELSSALVAQSQGAREW